MFPLERAILLLFFLWKDQGSISTNTVSPRMWGRHQVSGRCRGWARATQPERFSLLAERAVSTCFSLRLLIKCSWDLGSPQLCLGVHLLYLPHPLRISLQAILSTLMNALAVSERQAVSACPE